MITDAPGSPDGIRVQHYEAGETYDVPDGLGDTLVAHGVAETAKPASAAAKPAARSKRATTLENK